jgi:hypothetical protein
VIGTKKRENQGLEFDTTVHQEFMRRRQQIGKGNFSPANNAKALRSKYRYNLQVAPLEVVLCACPVTGHSEAREFF